MNPTREKTVAGVDGAKGEWVIARFDGVHMSWLTRATVDDVLDATSDCGRVGVDMPLSVPERGYRTSELEAKKFLGSARSSIFHTPVAEVLDASTYTEACEISRRITGKAISKQTWNILPAVRAWRAAPFDPKRYVEVHPECSFRVLDPSATFASKKSGRGVGQRLAALATLIDLGEMTQLPAGPAIDDFLDAAVAAWSAWRSSRGEHRVFGAPGDADRIVA